MRRCTISSSPVSSGSSRYLPRRSASRIVAPVSPSIDLLGRRPPHRALATDLDVLDRAPDDARRPSPRRTVSTSGSSGTAQAPATWAASSVAHAAAAADCSAAFFERPVPSPITCAVDDDRGEEALGVVGALGPRDVLRRRPAVDRRPAPAGATCGRGGRGGRPSRRGAGRSGARRGRTPGRARRRRTPRRARPPARRTGSTASRARRRRPRRGRAGGTTPRSSSSATSASASALTTPLRTPVSAPSGSSAKRRNARSATTQPSTASPRNSRRSLLSVPGCSAHHDRCAMERASSSGSANS